MNAQFVFRLLPSIENTSFVGEGRTGATSDSAAGNGVRRGATKLVGCTTAANGGLPERARIYMRLCGAYPWGFEISIRTVLPCTGVHRRIWFTRFKQGRKRLEVCGSVGGNDICHRRHRIFGRDK